MDHGHGTWDTWHDMEHQHGNSQKKSINKTQQGHDYKYIFISIHGNNIFFSHYKYIYVLIDQNNKKSFVIFSIIEKKGEQQVLKFI